MNSLLYTLYEVIRNLKCILKNTSAFSSIHKAVNIFLN